MALPIDDEISLSESGALAPASINSVDITRTATQGTTITEIGIVNNMSDSAFEATERQFSKLLNGASGETPIRLHFFALPSVWRSNETRARISRFYSHIDDLRFMKIDGLIVTGAEPRAATLPEEPYWDELAYLVDWAKENTRSTIWSCLAAHAAVLHLDGIQRQRLDMKCSGVYACTKQRHHWLLENTVDPLLVAHSRLNALADDELSAAGYEVVTRSAEAGTDMFAKNFGSEFVFFQGHPEYEPLSLKREFMRDVGRFVAGARTQLPRAPEHHFDAQTERRIARLRDDVMSGRNPMAFAERHELQLQPGIISKAHAAAETVFGNWIRYLASDLR